VPFRPSCLANYPYVVVRFSCWLCPRRGQARLARLAERHGADIGLEELLDRVAFSCPYPRKSDQTRKLQKYSPRCGIYLPDIETHSPRPPDEPPTAPKLVVNNDPDQAA